MEKLTIDIFLPLAADALDPEWLKEVAGHSSVKSIRLWNSGESSFVLPENVDILNTDSLSSTKVFKEMATLATADFVLCMTSASARFDVKLLDALVNALPDGVSMAYADYRKVVNGKLLDAPTIDCLSGSLRNDFDFGPALLFRSDALKRYIGEALDEYIYAGAYQLRLAMQRMGGIFHCKEFFSTVYEYDTRKSGEKQFDYVNPAQRDVQIEMEKACTHHLKEIDAFLPASVYKEIDLSIGEFPVEASVVIPVLNRHMTIADAISSVLKQKTSFPFNLIVVDNHSTDGTGEIIDSFGDSRVVHVVPERRDLGIGGCWNEAVNSPMCGRFAVQLDSDDIYSDENTLQRIVDEFYRQQCAMIVGTYRICDFELNTLPPGIIDHREWTEENGRNNALRVNGLGAPRAFFTPVIREIGFPNVSYGEDYAVGLQISRNYRIGRIYDVLYLCRRWGGNSDAALSRDLGIGGCWNEAVNSPMCGRFAVQLDSDDIYSDENTLQRIVDEFYRQQCAMIVGTYRICDFELNTLPPGIIDHREWTEENGRNNALRVNGLGAPRAFFTPVIREIGFPNVSYGEDYAVGLQISRNYRIGRIYDVLYLCRRWGGNSDAALSHEKVNAHNLYKDSLRTAELEARTELVASMGIPSREDVDDFLTKQLTAWPDAAERHAALDDVQVRVLSNGVCLQHNPARTVSTAAKVDSVSILERKCFLCAANRPAEQFAEEALGMFDVLVNPYPILPKHMTLPLKEHSAQCLDKMYPSMLHIAREWKGLALFYNGAKCGASAPDHAHLQAGDVSGVPLFGDYWSEEVECGKEPLFVNADGCIYNITSYIVPLFVVVSRTVSSSVELFGKLKAALPLVEGEDEPRMNVFALYKPEDGYVTVVIPRSAHRPACYCTGDDNGRMISPGALDMAGLIITPRISDFDATTADEAAGMLREVALSDDVLNVVLENLRGGYDEEC